MYIDPVVAWFFGLAAVIAICVAIERLPGLLRRAVKPGLYRHPDDPDFEAEVRKDGTVLVTVPGHEADGYTTTVAKLVGVLLNAEREWSLAVEELEEAEGGGLPTPAARHDEAAVLTAEIHRLRAEITRLTLKAVDLQEELDKRPPLPPDARLQGAQQRSVQER